MGNLISLLGTASNALSAFTASQQTAGHNMANASTPGYARQRVELATQKPEYMMGSWIGRGVLMSGVTQSRDAFLERQIPGALGSSARYNAECSALLAVGALDPEQAGSLTEAMGKFYGELRGLAQNPGDAGLRASVVGSAKSLAQAFVRVGNALEETRTGLDAKIESDVTEINGLTRNLAALNKQIVAAQAVGGRPNDLLDERVRVRDRLATLTGAVPVPDDRGNVGMVLPSGLALVSGGEAASLSVIADTANGGHLTVRVQRAGAGQPDSFSSDGAFGGELRGLIDARDGTLKQSLDRLDTLAFDFANTFNTQHRAGFALDGTPGQDLFVVGPTAAGASQTIDLNGAIEANPRLLAAAGTTPAGSGDATNLHALVGTERTQLSSGTDPGQTLADIVSSFGSKTRTARALSEQDSAIAEHLGQLREATSGVSLDEELVAMTQAQRAFEAMSKIIQVTDQMLDVLMKLK